MHLHKLNKQLDTLYKQSYIRKISESMVKRTSGNSKLGTASTKAAKMVSTCIKSLIK